MSTSVLTFSFNIRTMQTHTRAYKLHSIHICDCGEGNGMKRKPLNYSQPLVLFRAIVQEKYLIYLENYSPDFSLAIFFFLLFSFVPFLYSRATNFQDFVTIGFVVLLF